MDMYGFYTGQCFDAHSYLGAHTTSQGVIFRTFAPAASRVDLLWNNQELPMSKVYDGNFHEITVAKARPGDTYEFRIYHRNGTFQDHCDPYGFAMELRPKHKSVVCDLGMYHFTDGAWMKQRSNCLDKPLNIYELHLGSWRQNPDGSWYSYTETARELIPYLKESGFNYVEFLPISEHPCDESWGYQNTGFFAATSRYGTPQELMELIDLLHRNGIGAILDFVPVHFAVDAYALARYDGTALYEYPHSAVGVSEWGSYNFMHSRGEVRSFLQSSANFWLEQFHFDGLRMDAISRIIHWQGNEKRGTNGKALEFVKVMNQGLKQRHKGIMLIAEDSSHYPGVTKPVEENGLGFDYKWDMGWMHDTLEYFQLPPWQRTKAYHQLTFSMLYFADEQYLLPLSHDEVVHGKATILQKMNGQYQEKFPQARAMYLYMMFHPGKKMNFMGNEIGQMREWDEKRQQDWFLRTYPCHDSFYHFQQALNQLYLEHSAMYEGDYQKNGFRWIDCHQENRCIYVMERKSKSESLVALFHFDRGVQCYLLPEEFQDKKWKVLLHSDWEEFGGKTKKDLSEKAFDAGVELPDFCGIVLSCVSDATPNVSVKIAKSVC